MSTVLLPIIVAYAPTRGHSGRASGGAAQVSPSLHWNQLHVAANICLFPPLFFFTTLYYTDVSSTVAVCAFHVYMTKVYGSGAVGLQQQIALVLLGYLALSFRQTNIFWVSIFPAGLLLVSNLDRILSSASGKQPAKVCDLAVHEEPKGQTNQNRLAIATSQSAS